MADAGSIDFVAMAIGRIERIGGSGVVLTIRPRAMAIALHCFSRALHPELFQVVQTGVFDRNDYRVEVDITHEGHRIQFYYKTLTLCEVASSAHQPLPTRRLMHRGLIGDPHSFRTDAPRGVIYQTTYQREVLPAELFAMIHKEFRQKRQESDLLHLFESSGRVSIGAASLLHVDLRSRRAVVYGLHTFPDDLAIVKTTSSFELPSDETASDEMATQELPSE